MSPTTVPGLANVREISAGYEHTCALTADGAVWCWGSNSNGQLGVAPPNEGKAVIAGEVTVYDCGATGCGPPEGTAPKPESRATPVRTAIAHAKHLSAGSFHTCAIVETDVVDCWGSNGNGELGGGPPVESHSAPQRVVGLEHVVQVAASKDFTCALSASEGVRCWGGTSHTTFPTLKDVVQIATKFDATCALLKDGDVWCWGINDVGQLGDGTHARRAGPTKVINLGEQTEIAVGMSHACARGKDSLVRCWGQNYHDELGDDRQQGGLGNRSQPDLVPELGEASALYAGFTHTCATMKDRSIRCWGDGGSGQLGNGAPILRSWDVRPHSFQVVQQ
jgi:alpha-tubulin suppressor-like RCC1 family protein